MTSIIEIARLGAFRPLVGRQFFNRLRRHAGNDNAGLRVKRDRLHKRFMHRPAGEDFHPFRTLWLIGLLSKHGARALKGTQRHQGRGEAPI